VNLVQPRLSRGLRDLLAEDSLARQQMIDVVRGVYELYGFAPLITPAIEYLDVLSGSGGQEIQQSIFLAQNPEQEQLGLRFDHTVPLARVVAQYKDLPRPFRRYAIGPVWRADKPGPGRFREFVQFDIDSVGVQSESADTEIIAGMCDSMEALGVSTYQVRFSSRRVLNLLLTFASISPERATDVFRVIDKLEKVGPQKVRLELTTGYVDESGDRIPGLGLTVDQVDQIDRFLSIKSPKRADVIRQLNETFGNIPGASEEIGVLEKMSHNLDVAGYHDDRVIIDLSIARGLAYYNGPVFETVLLDAPQYGSMFSGGRYDDLVMRFLGERVPATGASMGVDRLLAALRALDKIRTRKSTADVLVTAFDPAMKDDYTAMTFELRRAGLRTELYLGTDRAGKQLKYADKLEIPVVLLYGPDEKSKGVVTIKDMSIGRARARQLAGSRDQWLQERPGQFEVPRAKLIESVRELLAKIGGGNH
jgi:histidyl-tRNA synthetase